jgi:hypothetical protein
MPLLRFYSCSLLLLYSADVNEKTVDIRLVDFARTVTPAMTFYDQSRHEYESSRLLKLRLCLTAFVAAAWTRESFWVCRVWKDCWGTCVLSKVLPENTRFQYNLSIRNLIRTSMLKSVESKCSRLEHMCCRRFRRSPHYSQFSGHGTMS